jgi:pectate lyase
MHSKMGFGFLAAVVIGCGSAAVAPAVQTAPGGNAVLAASPQSFSFGDVPVGRSTTRDVTLANTGTAAADITELVVSGPAFSATGLAIPTTLAPGASTTLTVVFTPPAQGSFGGMVVVSDAADAVTIAPTGNGVASGSAPPTSGPVAAFPGAEGAGAQSVGGRGGKVIAVTNLNDTGAGSLRACAEGSGPRTCVFRVAGTITLASTITVTSGNLTIAGQTAPGKGITLKSNGGFNYYLFANDAPNVVVRYVRFRNGAGAVAGDNRGNVVARGGANAVIFDHISTSWGNDEEFDIYSNSATRPSGNVTLSWSLLAEPLGYHPTGVAVGAGENPSSYADAINNVDFHHNLWHSVDHRAPIISAKGPVIVANNLIFNNQNWDSLSNGGAIVDYIGNKYLRKGGTTAPYEMNAFLGGSSYPTGNPSIYVRGNIGWNNSTPNEDPASSANWGMVGLTTNDSDPVSGNAGPLSISYRRTTASATTITTAPIGANGADLEGLLLDIGPADGSGPVGASRRLDCKGRWVPSRDTSDQNLIASYKTPSTACGRIYSPAQALSGDCGSRGVDAYASIVVACTNASAVDNSSCSCVDTDGDGMPDAWEVAQGLNPNDPTDANGNKWSGEMTNLEFFLSGRAPAP